MTTLGDPKITAFLDTKEVIVLATANPDGSPLAMAMWFLHDANSLTMISVDGLQKVKNLKRDPRVSVVAEGGTRPDLYGVALQGRAEFLADSPERRALVDRFHQKYDPELAKYWGGAPMPDDRVMFRVVPTRVRSWGL